MACHKSRSWQRPFQWLILCLSLSRFHSFPGNERHNESNIIFKCVYVCKRETIQSLTIDNGFEFTMITIYQYVMYTVCVSFSRISYFWMYTIVQVWNNWLCKVNLIVNIIYHIIHHWYPSSSCVTMSTIFVCLLSFETLLAHIDRE